jgi:hemoglobin
MDAHRQTLADPKMAPNACCGCCAPEETAPIRDVAPIGHVSEPAIRLLVDRFYAKVRKDPALGPIFEGAVEDWGSHLATMRNFWSSIMLTSGRYHGNPVAAHRKLQGLTPQLFERWLALFAETCGELFDDGLAAAFMVKARRIATSLQLALFYRPEHDRPRSAP